MNSATHLTLMVGAGVATPVPRAVLEALRSVRVITTAGETASGFELTFAIERRSPLNTLFLLSQGAAIPMVRVVVVVTHGGTPRVLIDGLMTHHDVTPGEASGTSTLTVMGRDLTTVMDYVDDTGRTFPSMPPEARVLAILAKYAALGVTPMVIPTVLLDAPSPTERVPVQKGTDLAYVRSLAEEVGYTFYLLPGPLPGFSRAYWGPEIRVGVPQPALNTDMDAHTNVESLNFGFDPEGPTEPVARIQIPSTRTTLPIPLPDLDPLRPPLGLVEPLRRRTERVAGTAKLSANRAAQMAMGQAARSGEAVSGRGSLRVQRYGQILEARRLVGVRGAGMAFDGLYFVSSVTHEIRVGDYRQSFRLTRNGLVSTVPVVPA